MCADFGDALCEQGATRFERTRESGLDLWNWQGQIRVGLTLGI